MAMPSHQSPPAHTARCTASPPAPNNSVRTNQSMSISGLTIKNVNTFGVKAIMLSAFLNDGSTLTISDSTFESNYYLAMLFDSAGTQVNASVIFRNCVFRNNFIGTNAMVSVRYLFGTQSVFQDCVFEGNQG